MLGRENSFRLAAGKLLELAQVAPEPEAVWLRLQAAAVLGSLGEAPALNGAAARANDTPSDQGDAIDMATGNGTAAAVNAAYDLRLARETAAGDVRDFMVSRYRAMPKPFEKMSELEQRQFVADCEHSSKIVIERLVDVIAAHGFRFVVGFIKKTAIGDVLQVQVNVSRSADGAGDLALSVGAKALVVLPGADEMMGQRDSYPIEPDQPDLV